MLLKVEVYFTTVTLQALHVFTCFTFVTGGIAGLYLHLLFIWTVIDCFILGFMYALCCLFSLLMILGFDKFTLSTTAAFS